MMNFAQQEFYVAGGTLSPDAPSYILRSADEELYGHIKKGDYCYILTPRQMGKSSLVARTAKRLQDEGVRTSYIDLTGIGGQKEKQSAEAWYMGIANCLNRDLGLAINLKEWWAERNYLGPLQVLMEFVEDGVLKKTAGPVVIFIDEIDSTIPLPFSDDFFAAIRSCYNARAVKADYNRITFVLLGCASPSELIKDSSRTPFNIGHSIVLADFIVAEARPLAAGLAKDEKSGEALLQRILYWSGGHPYLTQKLCSAAAAAKVENDDIATIDRLAEENFFKPKASQSESNLKLIRDRIVSRNWFMVQLLKLYRRIYQDKPVVDNGISPLHNALKLSGLVKTDPTGHLVVRNNIYRRTFTDQWAKGEIRPVYNRLIFRSLPAAAVVLVSLFYFFFLPMVERSIVDPVQREQRLKELREQFVLVDGGAFEMGDVSGDMIREYDFTSDEIPVHTVILDSFRISKYEITNLQYCDFLNSYEMAKDSAEIWLEIEYATSRIFPRGRYFVVEDRFKDHPVVAVSWFGAVAYAQWLCQQLGGIYRLPTEAEWEYACRADSETAFNTGENLSTNQANYDGNHPFKDYPKGFFVGNTMPVGSYPPNSWNLYDMHGNVWEWCSDWYRVDYYEECKNEGIKKNPPGPKIGSARVLRGGSWSSYSQDCRSACRRWDVPSICIGIVGFRLVFVPQ
ncbi:SUMF1/EgtB/PvdO family nonheme iron enzyme [candidate division KSB1 bacterium]|nr:SUMF1/EgtB/PvdO family nonheme iron enzyme [candidate division KSB1 bacterium]